MKGANVKMSTDKKNKLSYLIAEISSIASELTPEERRILAQRIYDVLVRDQEDPFDDYGWDGK